MMLAGNIGVPCGAGCLTCSDLEEGDALADAVSSRSKPIDLRRQCVTEPRPQTYSELSEIPGYLRPSDLAASQASAAHADSGSWQEAKIEDHESSDEDDDAFLEHAVAEVDKWVQNTLLMMRKC
mmetsp:Transcript_71796/g.168067  ORF Transcript_71796/g.168067 Transcript_71796/m.168067 type:complete len:124 (-) Transcript_71796:318-689(-)